MVKLLAREIELSAFNLPQLVAHLRQTLAAMVPAQYEEQMQKVDLDNLVLMNASRKAFGIQPK